MTDHRKNILTAVVSLWLGACSSVRAEGTPPRAYLDWLEALKKEMLQRGISQETIDKVYAVDYYHEKPQAVLKDQKQLEFVLTSDAYLNRVVSQERIEKGQKLYQDLRPLLNKLEESYALDGAYLMAFWGMETNYGTNFGGYNVFDALTEMSYDQRRSRFFKNELYHALKIVDEGKIDFRDMQGSWAGAMGHFQFMPSTYQAYAVDFNGDGKIDIWTSFEDAAASAANYLTSIGWKKGETWGIPVKVSWNFDYSLTGRNKPKAVSEWKKLGIKALNGQEIPLPADMFVSLIAPEGKNGQAYLVGDNFYKIMHWNRSENYALAVGLAADYIKSGKKWQKISKPAGDKLKTEDVLKVQAFINKIGLASLTEDGQLGSKTKEAVKLLQKKAMLPQDGYPDYRLLQKIEAYSPERGFSVPVPPRKLHKAK